MPADEATSSAFLIDYAYFPDGKRHVSFLSLIFSICDIVMTLGLTKMILPAY